MSKLAKTGLRFEPDGGLAVQEAAFNGELAYASFTPNVNILDELDKLFSGVEDLKERLHLISKAIVHLQRMQAQIFQAK